jgi:hypothetical protein
VSRRGGGEEWALLRKPVAVRRETYDQAVSLVVERLGGNPGIAAVYTVGSISIPGISDVDLLVVFEDGVRCDLDPLAHLIGPLRYPFTHGLFGVPRWYFADAVRYGFYPNLRLLQGSELDVGSPLGEQDRRALEVQLALEYLVENYISRSVEHAYRALNVRGLLLSAHAIRLDLQLLGIESGRLHDLVAQVGEWRKTWFERDGLDALVPWFRELVAELRQALELLLEAHPLYLPEGDGVRYARHIRVCPGADLRMRHRGLVLPPWVTNLGQRLVRLQNRFNRFEFDLPVTARAATAHLENRCRLAAVATRYNLRHLPHFSIPTPRLALMAGLAMDTAA